MTASAEERSDWSPEKAFVDESSFTAGNVGPYRLGMHLRATALGEVTLAIHDGIDLVVELDLFDALSRTPFVAPDGKLMAELAEIARITHPHVAPVIGAGIEAGVPYVVRAHRLGRTAAELFESTDRISKGAATCILFAAADAAAHLAAQGPAPGACSMGGYDARDLHLGYDGTIALTGTGLRLVRAPERDAAAADLESTRELARELDRRSGADLSRAISGANTLDEVVRQIRRNGRDALARRAELIGGVLREQFDGAIREERAFFGMPPLQ